MKEIYVRPEIEVIEVESENVIAASFGSNDIEDADDNVSAYSRRRSFWN